MRQLEHSEICAKAMLARERRQLHGGSNGCSSSRFIGEDLYAATIYANAASRHKYLNTLATLQAPSKSTAPFGQNMKAKLVTKKPSFYKKLTKQMKVGKTTPSKQNLHGAVHATPRIYKIWKGIRHSKHSEKTIIPTLLFGTVSKATN